MTPPTATADEPTLTDTTGGSTNGDTEVWTYTYNGTGELLTETFPRTGNHRQKYLHLLFGRSGQHHRPAFAHDHDQHRQRHRPADGDHRSQQRRHRFRLRQPQPADQQDGPRLALERGDEHHLYRLGPADVVTLPDSSTITYNYDNAQRVTKITNTAGETINYTLDAMGDVTALAIKDSGGTTQKIMVRDL